MEGAEGEGVREMMCDQLTRQYQFAYTIKCSLDFRLLSI